MINPADPPLISPNAARRSYHPHRRSDRVTNQPFKSYYHLDNSTLLLKQTRDTRAVGEGGEICFQSAFVRALMFVLKPSLILSGEKKGINKPTGGEEQHVGWRWVYLRFPSKKPHESADL